MKNRRTIKIAQMADFFLYLPLYYAKSREFFGLIDKRKYNIEMQNCGTDREAVRALLDDQGRKSEDVLFAVGDPIQVLNSRKLGPRPVVLGGLITSAAFWAVDHGSFQLGAPTELNNYDKIIAYPPGSTCHDLAVKLASEHKIYNVSVMEEFDAVEGFRASNLKAVALTPDILRAARRALDGRNGFEIDMSLAAHTGYSDFLVTALMSHTGVVNDQQLMKEVVLPLMRAVHRGLLLVRGRVPSTWNAALDRLSDVQDDEEGIKAFHGAMQRAIECHAFPAGIDINYPHWENRLKAAGRTADEAETAYNTYVAPYKPHAQEAVRLEAKELGGVLGGKRARPRTLQLVVSAFGLVLLGMFLMAIVLTDGGMVVRVGVSILAVVMLLAAMVGLRQRPRLAKNVVWCVTVSYLGVLVAYGAFMGRLPDSSVIHGGGFLFLLSVLVAVLPSAFPFDESGQKYG